MPGKVAPIRSGVLRIEVTRRCILSQHLISIERGHAKAARLVFVQFECRRRQFITRVNLAPIFHTTFNARTCTRTEPYIRTNSYMIRHLSDLRLWLTLSRCFDMVAHLYSTARLVYIRTLYRINGNYLPYERIGTIHNLFWLSNTMH